MRKINHIVLHCTATQPTATVASIQHYWRNTLGWRMPGYHWLIGADGKANALLPVDMVSNGVAGHNHDSIHISYVGGIDKAGKPKDTRTEAQIRTQIELIKKYRSLFPGADVLGHRDFPGVKKACPSFDVASWLKKVGL